ncbi:MAG: histidine kinase, partial [Rhodospirillaceae bacterium]
MGHIPNIARLPLRAGWARARLAEWSRSRERPEAVHTLEAAHARMIVLMRCVLSFSALAIVYIDPSEPARLVPLTYGSLAAYCVYSALVAWRSYTRGWPAARRFAHWIDIVFYTWLVGLTEGTASIFFYFFFFAILVAAFSYGYREGLRVTLASALCFAGASLLYPSGAGDFELNRALIRPVYLFTLGYMMTHWGGQEVLLKRRLRLLHDVNSMWSPRFGLEHTLGANLQRLVEFYAADSCVLVLKKGLGHDRPAMYVALPGKPGSGGQRSELGAETAAALLAPPGGQAVLYSDERRVFGRSGPRCEVLWSEGVARPCDAQACARAANILDTRYFITVPYVQRDGTEGRLYLDASRRLFSPGDTEFLLQFAAAVAVVSESLHLMEQLISKAAEHERYKISRDLHDSTIQPYIGLKLGLEGLYRDIGGGGPVAARVRDMIEMTNETIADLRRYADRLRHEDVLSGEFLVSAIREQAERYHKYYGIRFAVD